MNTRTAIKTAFLALLTLGSLNWSTQAEAQIQYRVFVLPPNNEIRMASGSGFWCVLLEPTSGFQVTDVNLCSVVLISPGTGSVSQISYDCTKTTVVGDQDGNGLQEIHFCFLKTAMQPLFDQLHGASPKTVTLTLQARLNTGETISGAVAATLYLKN